MKSHFIDNITHEFNTPVSTLKIIAANIKKLNEEINSKALEQISTRVENQASRLSGLIGKVMSLSVNDKGLIASIVWWTGIATNLDEPHADWGSGGRWGVEANTKENSYQLIPLEDLFVCKKEAGTWNHVALTWDDVSDNAYIYINGIADAGSPDTTTGTLDEKVVAGDGSVKSSAGT